MKTNRNILFLIVIALISSLALVTAGCGGSNTNNPSDLTWKKPDKMLSLEDAWKLAVNQFKTKKQIDAKSIRLNKIRSQSLKDGKSLSWTFSMYVDEGSDWDKVANYDVSIINGKIGPLRRLEPAFQLQAMSGEPIDKSINMDSAAYTKAFDEKGGAELQTFRTDHPTAELVLDGSGGLTHVAEGIQVFDTIRVSLSDRGDNKTYFAAYFDPYTGAYLNRVLSTDGQEQALP